ncbi:MAG: hypothetical protein GY839_09150 [candidate division Zixibacteria bacterium]|nr:hypothetical protein [candidate division Zixibacteria bacterium]
MYHVKIIQIIAFLLACLMSLSAIVFANESDARQARVERLEGFLKSFSIDNKAAVEIRSSLSETGRKFTMILDAKSEFESKMRSGHVKEKVGVLQNYRDAHAKLFKDYSGKISDLMKKLDKHLDENEIATAYRFLYDELWYEGFANESSVETRKALGYHTEPTFDSTSLINNYTYEELEEMEEEYLEGENEALISDVDPPDTTAIIKETTDYVSRPPVSVDYESPTRQDLPPWHDFPAPPATTYSIGNLLKNQSLPVLHYYWLELAPLADSLITASQDK